MKSPRPSDPRQFGIIDLFAILTVIALFLAMAMPLVRRVPGESLRLVWLIMLFQVGAWMTTMVFLSNRRRHVLKIAGPRIGTGYCGNLNWSYWPVFLSIARMVVSAWIQLVLSIVFVQSLRKGGVSPMFMLYIFQLGFGVAIAHSRQLWRVYPNSMEFFENGLSLTAIALVPWKGVTVRLSAFHPDRIVVVMPFAASKVAGTTTTVQLAQPERERVFAAVARGQN